MSKLQRNVSFNVLTLTVYNSKNTNYNNFVYEMMEKFIEITKKKFKLGTFNSN